MTADTTGLLLARLLGAATVGFAAVTWLLRSAGDPDARRGLVLALFIGWGAGLVVSFIGLGASPLGWVNVVMYGFFTVAYAYFQFTTPGAAMPKPMTSSTLSAPPAASPAPARPAASRAPARRTPARRRK
jgi:hypothetical protein